MWLLTEWQLFNDQFEAEENRARKLREYMAYNVIDFSTSKNYLHQDAATHKGVKSRQKEDHISLLDDYHSSVDIEDGAEDNEDNKDQDDDAFEPDDAKPICPSRRKDLLYRVGLGIIAIIGVVCLLSLPEVPERFLGIRSPKRVLMEYRLTPHPSNDSNLHPIEVSQQPHSVKKRHIRVPHKFWAKARPHNKFKKKKRYAHPQVPAPPEAPVVPKPHIVHRH